MTWLSAPARVAAVLAALAIFAAVELKPQIAAADSLSINLSMLRQRSLAASGTATGNATAGPAIAANDLALLQRSTQTGGGTNTNQTAVNFLNLDQTAIATSGDATGLDRGTATSGAATAGNLAVVEQTNDQAISGAVPSGGVRQSAVNVADIGQTAAAKSGEATSSGPGAISSSGDASSLNVTVVEQRTLQTYGGPTSGEATGSVVQTASNMATVDETTGAISGRATASVSSTGNSGSASSSASTYISQGATQAGGQ